MPAEVTRGRFLKGTAAVAVASGMPAFIRSRGEAADVLRIGLIEELTGVSGDIAKRNVYGAQMALDEWNRHGGVMGRRVEFVTEDDRTNPGVAVEKARKLINQDRVVALMGAIQSADSLAVSAAANSQNIVYVDAGAEADQIVGKDCHWTTFMTVHNTWDITQATGSAIAQQLGKERWFFLTPDFAYGHSIVRGYEEVIKKLGGSVVGNALVPLGTTDFSTYITKIESAAPNVLVASIFGANLLNFVKQARGFGLLAKLPLAGPILFYEDAWAMAPEDRVGYWGLNWYYKSDLVYSAKNTLANQFVTDYRARFHEPPADYSCLGYVSADRLLWAIDTAKSTDSIKIARTLEGAKFHALWDGETYFSPVNHGLVWPMWFGKLEQHPPADDPYDVVKVISRQPVDPPTAASLARRGQACSLGWPS